jgi:hypothetical protein
LLDPESDVFKAASMLNKGQRVRFSGSFFRNRIDCVKEKSLTLSGSMDDPEYLFRFAEIKIDDGTSPPMPRSQTDVPRPTNEFKLIKGKMQWTGSRTLQPIGVTNASGGALRYLAVECGFYKGEVLVGSDFTNWSHVAENETAYGEVNVNAEANTSDCRIQKASPK